jgi:hypothetical protein
MIRLTARSMSITFGRGLFLVVQPYGTVSDCPRMAERNFIVLRYYEGKVPAMAGCEKCQRKFFTPTIYSSDAAAAQEYLFSKFDHHNCDKSQRKTPLAW